MAEKILYDYNVAVIKRYTDDKYKLTVHNVLRRRGYEYESDKLPKLRNVNNDKLLNNITRARNTVFEYALCNDWQYFATLTLDGRKYNRYDLKKYIKDLGSFLHNINKRRDIKVKYLLIPEQHKDGAWHLHGLFMGFNDNDLVPFTRDMFNNGKIPIYILNHIDDNVLFKWQKYSDKFGYCVFDKIRDKDRVSSYILKYFSKDMSKSVIDLNARLFYSSHGLKKAVEIKRGLIDNGVIYNPDYVNDFVSVKWINKKDIDKIKQVNYNSFTLYKSSVITRQKYIKYDWHRPLKNELKALNKFGWL
jgi:hypothetical protein